MDRPQAKKYWQLGEEGEPGAGLDVRNERKQQVQVLSRGGLQMDAVICTGGRSRMWDAYGTARWKW